MCGRYYVDDATAREVEKLVRQINARLQANRRRAGGDAADSGAPGDEARLRIRPGDFHPGDEAPVISSSDGALRCEWQRWGLTGFKGGSLIFNARSESALEKKTFRDGVAERRIVIPAAGFYEWSGSREKNSFFRRNQPVLFMAGFYNSCGGRPHFVILTTGANESVRRVHSRMPLILEREEVDGWIFDGGRTELFLNKTPGMLERSADYEQLAFPTNTY